MICADGHNLKFKDHLFDKDYSKDKLLGICKQYELESLGQLAAKSTLIWQLYASELMKKIIKTFDNVANNQDNLQTKRTLFYFDSCHDTNILALMKVLGIDYPNIIPFASSLFFELHEDDLSNKLFVKVYFNNEELDINVIEHPEATNALIANVTDTKLLKSDEPDQDSSFYFYLKRFLHRRVLSEPVDTYCSKTPEEMIFVEKSIKASGADSNTLLLLIVFISIFMTFSIGVFVILYISRCQYSNEEDLCKDSARKDTPTLGKLMPAHIKFYDEEEANDNTTRE